MIGVFIDTIVISYRQRDYRHAGAAARTMNIRSTVVPGLATRDERAGRRLGSGFYRPHRAAVRL